MAKIITSNIITFTLVYIYFTLFSSSQHHKGLVDDPNAKKELIAGLDEEHAQSNRASMESHFKKGNKVQWPTERYQAELFKKYRVNDDDWRDLYVKFHNFKVEHEGEIINEVDIYKDFYNETYRILKNFYPTDGEERMFTYLTLRNNLRRQKNKLCDLAQISVNRIQRDFEKKSQSIDNNLDLSEDERERLKEKLVQLYSSRTSPTAIRDQKLTELDIKYEANIKKVFGKVYPDIQERLESYNSDLHNKYGNQYYYTTYDDVRGEMLPPGQKIRVDVPDEPRFSLVL